ncbi:MAG TPA: hypothetical protein VMU45_10670 [Candidatus Eisenbacteria bacterium]|nr:hypothetical protein [Candidatus Eisenbacteria bacterium]
MKNRVAIWAGVGFLVASCWAVYAFVTPPESFLVVLREPLVQAALYLTCPISYAGRYYPIQFWWVLLTNAATYALVGLILEMFRTKSKQSLLA